MLDRLREPLADVMAAPARVPRLAQVLTGAVLMGLLIAALISGLQTQLSPPRTTLLLGALVVNGLIQVAFFGSQRFRGRPRATLFVLVFQGLLVWGLVLFLGQAALGQVGFLVGSVLLATPARVAAPLALLMVGLVGRVAFTSTGSWPGTWYAVDATVVTGSVVFGLTALPRFVVDLHRARADLASLAVAAERDRFARDLHDLLGFSLSAITLKSELARAVVTDHPQQAQAELAELGAISRQALKDVRRVAHGGGGGLTLGREVDTAVSLLRAASISVRVEHDSASTARLVDDVVGTVLREAVTNVLRHSRATTCVVSLHVTDTTIALGVDNDGVSDDDTSVTSGQGGLRNMRERTVARGGTWRADRDGSWFRLAITVPYSR